MSDLVNLGGEALQALGDNDMLLSLSQGCKSNKDRGGMGNVEQKWQAITQDMGGSVEPVMELSEQDRVIYNTVLTSSGQLEMQQRNTGLPGSKNAGEVRNRIGDDDALAYAEAYKRFAKS